MEVTLFFLLILWLNSWKVSCYDCKLSFCEPNSALIFLDLCSSIQGLFGVHKSASDNLVAPWAVLTLIEAGAPYPSLLEAYNNLPVAQESGPSYLLSK